MKYWSNEFCAHMKASKTVKSKIAHISRNPPYLFVFDLENAQSLIPKEQITNQVEWFAINVVECKIKTKTLPFLWRQWNISLEKKVIF